MKRSSEKKIFLPDHSSIIYVLLIVLLLMEQLTSQYC